MIPLPQHGGCLCGDVRYTLRDEPITIYACHCTDCQTETGSAFYLAVVVRTEGLEYTGRQPETWTIELPDGRTKGALHCPRCNTNLGGGSRFPGVASIDGGTFDETQWIAPAGHIWTRSAQPWIRLPESHLQFPEAPGDRFIDLVHAWKAANGSR